MRLAEHGPGLSMGLGARQVHVKKLRFVAKPDYRYLRSLFRELFGREGFVHDAAYDWTSVEPRAADETGQWIAAPLRPAE